MRRPLFSFVMSLFLSVPPLLAAQEQTKTIIGRAETVWLPEWGIVVPAKIDTGAYRGSLHVSALEYVSEQPQTVRFQTADREGTIHTVETPVAAFVKVKSSFGRVEKRPAIRARLCLAGHELEAIISLTDRSDMRFPMLVGRKILKGRFLIDPDLRQAHKKATCRQAALSPSH